MTVGRMRITPGRPVKVTRVATEEEWVTTAEQARDAVAGAMRAIVKEKRRTHPDCPSLCMAMAAGVLRAIGSLIWTIDTTNGSTAPSVEAEEWALAILRGELRRARWAINADGSQYAMDPDAPPPRYDA